MRRKLRTKKGSSALQLSITAVAVLVAIQGIPSKLDETLPDNLLEHVASLGNRYDHSHNLFRLNSDSGYFQTVASANFTAGLDIAEVPTVVAEEKPDQESDSQLAFVAETPIPLADESTKGNANSAHTRGPVLTIEDIIEFSSAASVDEDEETEIEDAADAGHTDLIASEVNILPRPKFKKSFDETALLAYAPRTGDATESEEITSLYDLFNKTVVEEEEVTDSHNWIYGELPISVVSESEQKCLAQAVYFEARGEVTEGQVAVAQVVLNRVRDSLFPNSICEVVFQNEFRRHGCQFSFACDGISERIHSVPAWNKAQRIARNVTYGVSHLENVGRSTHFHAVYVDPDWAKSMEKKAKIGLHIFYLAKL